MIAAVRRSVAIAVAALTALLGGAALSDGQGSIVASIQTHPSGFVLRPNIADPGCNGGRGLEWAAGLGEIPVVASAALPDGSTLITVSSGGFPTKRSVVLYSITPACTLDIAFGSDGVATLSPAQTEPKDQLPGGELDGLQVDVIAPASGGGAFLAGSFGGHWTVGKVTPQGQPNLSFGDEGWSVLPFDGEVTSVVQQQSGEIAIAGSNGGGGCCTTNWIAALSPTGALETAFGAGGREELPTGEDSGVGPLVLEPNGDILAPVGYGNMGCWGVSLAMLTPAGKPVPLFQQRLSRFWQALRAGAFVGDVYADGAGFTVIGTGQNPCYGSSPAPSSTGLIAHFTAAGAQVGKTIKFSSRSFGLLQAFPVGTDTLIAETPYANATRLTIEALRPNASLDTRFASNGIAEIRTPWSGTNAELQTQMAISEANPGTIVVVAQDGDNQLQLTRLDI